MLCSRGSDRIIVQTGFLLRFLLIFTFEMRFDILKSRLILHHTTIITFHLTQDRCFSDFRTRVFLLYIAGTICRIFVFFLLLWKLLVFLLGVCNWSAIFHFFLGFFIDRDGLLCRLSSCFLNFLDLLEWGTHLYTRVHFFYMAIASWSGRSNRVLDIYLSRRMLSHLWPLTLSLSFLCWLRVISWIFTWIFLLRSVITRVFDSLILLGVLTIYGRGFNWIRGDRSWWVKAWSANHKIYEAWVACMINEAIAWRMVFCIAFTFRLLFVASNDPIDVNSVQRLLSFAFVRVHVEVETELFVRIRLTQQIKIILLSETCRLKVKTGAWCFQTLFCCLFYQHLISWAWKSSILIAGIIIYLCCWVVALSFMRIILLRRSYILRAESAFQILGFSIKKRTFS